MALKTKTSSFIIFEENGYYCAKNYNGEIIFRDASSVDNVMQSALDVGGKYFLLKSGLMWIPKNNLIPSGIIVEGEDIDKVDIKVVDPNINIFRIGPKTILINLKITDAGTNGKNAGDSAHN